MVYFTRKIVICRKCCKPLCGYCPHATVIFSSLACLVQREEHGTSNPENPEVGYPMVTNSDDCI